MTGPAELPPRGELTTLVRWRPDHAGTLAEIADDVDVARYLLPTFPSPYGLRDAIDWIAANRFASPPLQFAIEAAGELVGSIGVRLETNERRGSAEIGYFIGKRSWGRGFATDAVRSVAAYAFELPGIYRAWANPIAANRASARVLEKAGFTHVATIPLGMVDRAGRRHDESIYARFAPTSTPEATA